MALGVKICLLDTIFRLVGNALETFANCLKSLFPETTGSAVIPRNNVQSAASKLRSRGRLPHV